MRAIKEHAPIKVGPIGHILAVDGSRNIEPATENEAGVGEGRGIDVIHRVICGRCLVEDCFID
jgi:hypothetical protein